MRTPEARDPLITGRNWGPSSPRRLRTLFHLCATISGQLEGRSVTTELQFGSLTPSFNAFCREKLFLRPDDFKKFKK